MVWSLVASRLCPDCKQVKNKTEALGSEAAVPSACNWTKVEEKRLGTIVIKTIFINQ